MEDHPRNAPRGYRVEWLTYASIGAPFEDEKFWQEREALFPSYAEAQEASASVKAEGGRCIRICER